MLNKCANPMCSARFMYLHEGVLYSFDFHRIGQVGRQANSDFGGSEDVHEYFWLCRECSWEMTLHRDNEGRVVLVPARHGSVFGRSVRTGKFPAKLPAQAKVA